MCSVLFFPFYVVLLQSIEFFFNILITAIMASEINCNLLLSHGNGFFLIYFLIEG